MPEQIKLKNREDEYVVIDQKVLEDIQANEYLMSIKLLDNLRAHSHGYAVFQRCITTKQGPIYETIYLHKYIAEKYCPKPKDTGKKMFIRFINGNPQDVRLENLEWTTMNLLRRQMPNYSGKAGFRGVTIDKGRFRAVIYDEKVPVNLGTFDTAEEAAEAYNKKSIELFGVTASLNIIPHPNNK